MRGHFAGGIDGGVDAGGERYAAYRPVSIESFFKFPATSSGFERIVYMLQF
jgi:hypothetical protein